MNTLRIVPVALTLAAAAAAQIPIHSLPTRGMMPAFPAGVIMSPGDEILKKRVGLPVQPLVPFDTPDKVADYSVQVIMGRLRQRADPHPLTDIVVDAMSSGNDALPLVWHGGSNSFRIGQGDVGWAVLYLAMENDPIVGDAVMGYYFNNPSFPSELRNGIWYELLPSDFPVPGIPSSLDIAMGLLEDNYGEIEVGAQRVVNRVYFSLTQGSADLLYRELDAASALLELASGGPYTLPQGSARYTGATIFAAMFDNHGVIQDVGVCADWSTLAIGASDDVDALAVAEAQAVVPTPNGCETLQPGRLQYVFSLDTQDANRELLATADVTIGPTVLRKHSRLRGNNGNDIVGGIGTLQGRVSAICAQDPEIGGYGARAFGEPDGNGTPDAQPHLSLSLAVRTTTPSTGLTDNLALTGVVSGWAGNQQDSLVCLWMEVVDADPSHPLYGFRTSYVHPVIRPATADYLVLTPPPFDVPWVGAWTNGVFHCHTNRFRFWVEQVGLTLPHTESFRSLVFRRQTQ